MLISLERSIDGVVGRMLSWLSQPPVRPLVDRESSSDRAMELVDKTSVVVAGGIESATKAAEELVVETVVETVVEPSLESSSDRPKRRTSRNKIDSKKTTRRKATRSKRSVAGRQKAAKVVEKAAESIESPTKTGDLEASIAAALAGVDDGLAMKELVAVTGAERNAIRRSLERLSAGHQVQRKGEGMRTRYYWTEGG